MTRDQLLEQLNAEFNALMDAVEGLSEEQMLKKWYDGWSVRDILAHIAGWHWEMAGALERIARGERPTPEGEDYNSDRWNARFAEEAKDLSPDEVIDDLHASKEAFVAAALLLPEERFEEGRAAYRILMTTGIEHYREHRPAILEWQKKEGI
jgi:hypothetical protein